MFRARTLLPLVFALVPLAAPAFAVPGGEIDTLEIGNYVCELPGDALGPRGEVQAAENFAVVFGGYRAHGVRGTYLLTGDTVVMTSGPRKGERYNRISPGFLRRQNADGSDGSLRCVIANRTNTFAADTPPDAPQARPANGL